MIIDGSQSEEPFLEAESESTRRTSARLAAQPVENPDEL